MKIVRNDKMIQRYGRAGAILSIVAISGMGYGFYLSIKKPEYINTYEMAFQTFLGQSMFSLEGYYHLTENKIERVRTVYQANVTLHTFDNVGAGLSLRGGPIQFYVMTDYALGLLYPDTSRSVGAWFGLNLIFGCRERVMDDLPLIR